MELTVAGFEDQTLIYITVEIFANLFVFGKRLVSEIFSSPMVMG